MRQRYFYSISTKSRCINVVCIFFLQYAYLFDIKVINVVYYSCNCLLKVLCYYIQVAAVSFVVFVVVAVVRLFSCLFIFMYVFFYCIVLFLLLLS